MKARLICATRIRTLTAAILVCALAVSLPAEVAAPGSAPPAGTSSVGAPPADASPAGDLAKGPVSRELEGGLLVQLEILPRPIEAMKDLVFVVSLARSGKPVEDAELSLDLTMPAMYMGKNNPVLQNKGGGRFEGKGVLPRCMSGDKRWQAEVLIREPSGVHKVAFLFEIH